MPAITTFNTIRAAKDQVQTLKMELTTLKTLGFDELLGTSSNLQATFLLVDLEGKIPIEGYTQWMAEKERLKQMNAAPNLETFTKWYEKIVGQQADAIYIRRQIEEVSSDAPRKPRDSKNRKGELKKDTRNLLKTEVLNPESSKNPTKGKYKNAYCIVEDCKGHGSAFCLNGTCDYEY